MPELRETQARLQALRAARDAARAALRGNLLTVRELEHRLAQERRAATPNNPEALRRIEELERELAEASRRVGQNRDDLRARRAFERGIAAELLALTPQQLIEGFSDSMPVLLLPVHIETKFVGSRAEQELWIRVYPDDIAITSHERTLAAGEAADGEVYWTARAAANAMPTAQERQNAAHGAWNMLAVRHGAHRGAWIARSTRPTNWQDDSDDPEALDFPPVETKSLDSTEAPRSFVLPDRFVFVLFSGTSRREVVGSLIPDDLALGPDPLGAEGLLTRDEDTGRLVIDDNMRWLIDFDLAVEVGMARRIPLEPQELGGLDRIIVLGLRTSSSAADGAKRLEQLIEAHRFGEGMAIVPQGTPTNNTDSVKSGFTTSNEAEADALWPEREGATITSETDHLLKRDGQRLAETLALPLAVIAPLPNAARSDIAEAIAMNRALWGATLGGFLKDVMKPHVDEVTMRRTQHFFTAFVLGRGLLPALRVAEQPYGVLITSAFARWKWQQAEVGEEAEFWNGLGEKLARLEQRWRELLPQVAFAGKPGADPFVNLIAILGLQASSVEFYSRKAIYDEYLWNYLSFQRVVGFASRLLEELTTAKRDNLIRLMVSMPDLPIDSFQRFTFLSQSGLLGGPVIDGDPRIPLSEERPIRPFDDTRNYIDWLIDSPRADIDGEVFRDAKGTRIAAPSALLYQLLRHAYLSELGRGGEVFLKERVAHVFGEMPAEPPVANVSPATQTLSRRDLLEVDTSRVGVSQQPLAVGDYLLSQARLQVEAFARAPEAAALADKTDALRMLAKLPTARLERCFAEHLDVCGYRLDAWIQGLFARRLTLLRGLHGRQETGTYLGAYGWVEDVRPTTTERRTVPPQEVPEPLRSELDANVVEYENSGGYVHAPSLTHAVTAAVLRNAYLTHASAADATTMAVNLSSSRARTALSYIEGLRNGQELAALLGYQFERGLHENHPGVELDEFVYVFRNHFPFVSKKITPVPDGTAAELVEARNVVNGYDLLQHVQGKTYPYDIAGLPTDEPRASAIRAEINALADAMDAVGDLALAEGVHQVVQGNYDRAKGILQTATEGGAPPDIEVVTMPRSGRSLTHRIALHLDPAQTMGWNTPLTPRAAANRPLNHWLTNELPAPEDVQWKVTLAGVDAFVGLDQLGLEAIDVVLMAGEQLYDQSSELARFLVYAYHRDNAVPDDVVTFFFPTLDPEVPVERRLIFDPAEAEPGKHALASIWPLLGTLRRLIAQNRPLHAQDHALPTEAAELDAANPRGWDDGTPPLQDVKELKDRIEATHTALNTIVRTQLEAFLTTTVRPLYDAFKNDPNRVIAPQWTAHLATLRVRLEEVLAFGVSEALPVAGRTISELNIDAMVLQAETVVKIMKARLDEARKKLDLVFPDPLPADPDTALRERARRTEQRLTSYTDAARALLGRSFTPVPLFRLHAVQRAELAAALAAPVVADPVAVETWMQSLMRVRESMGVVSWLLAYHEWIHDAPRALQPIQLPVRAGDRWIGEEFGQDLGPGDVMSIALLNTPSNLGGLQCGLLLDEWTEVVPTLKETTGIALHANRPNAVAPQALLLAVAPELRGSWRWDDLLATVAETLDRAQRRAIEPDIIAGTEFFQLLPAVLTEFGSGFTLVSTTFNRNLAVQAVATGPG